MDACFIVRDANRQALTYVYFEEEQGKRRSISSLTGTAFARYATPVRHAWCATGGPHEREQT